MNSMMSICFILLLLLVLEVVDDRFLNRMTCTGGVKPIKALTTLIQKVYRHNEDRT